MKTYIALVETKMRTMRKMAFSGNEYSKKRAQMSLAQLGDGGWKQLEQAPEGRVARNMMVGGGV